MPLSIRELARSFRAAEGDNPELKMSLEECIAVVMRIGHDCLEALKRGETLPKEEREKLFDFNTILAPLLLTDTERVSRLFNRTFSNDSFKIALTCAPVLELESAASMAVPAPQLQRVIQKNETHIDRERLRRWFQSLLGTGRLLKGPFPSSPIVVQKKIINILGCFELTDYRMNIHRISCLMRQLVPSAFVALQDDEVVLFWNRAIKERFFTSGDIDLKELVFLKTEARLILMKAMGSTHPLLIAPDRFGIDPHLYRDKREYGLPAPDLFDEDLEGRYVLFRKGRILAERISCQVVEPIKRLVHYFFEKGVPKSFDPYQILIDENKSLTSVYPLELDRKLRTKEERINWIETNFTYCEELKEALLTYFV